MSTHPFVMPEGQFPPGIPLCVQCGHTSLYSGHDMTPEHESTMDASGALIPDDEESTVDMSPEARVFRGITYLRQHYARGAVQINLSTLDISSCHECIMGQIHGNYGDAPEILMYREEWFESHGFARIDADADIPQSSTHSLEYLWARALETWWAE